jgi:hypothetical protein
MIVAQNSNFSCHRGRVNIRVEVLPNSVQFPVLDPESVPEDADVGTNVSQVEALGGWGTIRYSFASGGDGGGTFLINASSGVITLASPLDFEIQEMYTLTIVGTINGTGITGSTSLEVAVLDANERPEFLTLCARGPPVGTAECTFSVLENQPNSTFVDMVAALDPDLPTSPNGMVTFDLIDFQGTGAGFRVQRSGANAQVITTESFDRESTPMFSFVLRVLDGGTLPLSSDVMVTVLIEDENDNAPEFVQAPALLNIRESAGVGATVTQYIAVDADVGVNADIRYSLFLETPSGLNATTSGVVPFAIDPTSGVLTISAELDFEEKTTYIIAVLASNPDGLRSNVTTVISIVDVNDNPPIFTQDVYAGSVMEGASSGFPIVSVFASDADSGFNGRVLYAIEAGGNPGGSLSIEPQGVLASIVVSQEIDREMMSVFNLTIRAVDMGMPMMSDTALAVITVLDVNDNPPVFTQAVYMGEIREDAGPMDIVSVSAFDADQPQTNNSDINFGLNATNVSDIFELVAVDRNTATLRLIGQLDFEERQLYELQVIASDRGATPLVGVATILVNVTNHNEFPPEVSGNQTVEVSEGDQPGTRIAQVIGMDPDNEQLSFTVTSVSRDNGGVVGNSDLSLFSIDSNGFVSISGELDFEASQSYVIEVDVSDGEFSSFSHITVIILDVNEFCPTVEGMVFSVMEEEPNGTIVGTLVATDGDVGPGADVTFALIRDTPASNLFTIDPQSGNISTTEVLDREALMPLFSPSQSFTEQVRVVVTDSGLPPCSNIATVEILLVDVNDNSPVFLDIPPRVFVMETSDGEIPGQFVVNAMATDSDEGANSVVEYSVSVAGVTPPEPLPFAINGSGVLRTAVRLDAEETSSYEVTLTAFDNGQPSLSSNVEIIVSITDINDNVPIFSQQSYEVSVPEDVSPDEILIEVLATDGDLTERNSAVAYAVDDVTPPVPSSQFFIDPVTGGISAVGGLDFETSPTYVLVVTARDSGIPQLSASVSVTVNVLNVDEAPPRFLSDDCSIGILEEVVQPGSSVPVGVCNAADVDEITGEFLFGAPLDYEIVSGNTGDVFSISNDGTLFLDGLIDREVVDSYALTVLVRDGAGLNDTTVVQVTVQDINDNFPVILNTPLTRVVQGQEIAMATSDVVVVVEASDDDIGVNSDLVYTLLEVDVALDGLAANVTVMVSDRGVNPLTTTATIRVQFEVPCFVQDYAVHEADGNVIGQYLCSIGIEPESQDVAIGQRFELTCSVLTNLNVTFEFRHNGSTVTNHVGGVLVTDEATPESTGEYLCLVSTEVGGLTSDVASIRTKGEIGGRWEGVKVEGGVKGGG